MHSLRNKTIVQACCDPLFALSSLFVFCQSVVDKDTSSMSTHGVDLFSNFFWTKNLTNRPQKQFHGWIYSSIFSIELATAPTNVRNDTIYFICSQKSKLITFSLLDNLQKFPSFERTPAIQLLKQVHSALIDIKPPAIEFSSKCQERKNMQRNIEAS